MVLEIFQHLVLEIGKIILDEIVDLIDNIIKRHIFIVILCIHNKIIIVVFTNQADLDHVIINFPHKYLNSRRLESSSTESSSRKKPADSNKNQRTSVSRALLQHFLNKR